MPEIVVHRIVRLSYVIVSDVLESDHLLILFHILNHVSATNTLVPVEIHIDGKRFRSVASDII